MTGDAMPPLKRCVLCRHMAVASCESESTRESCGPMGLRFSFQKDLSFIFLNIISLYLCWMGWMMRRR